MSETNATVELIRTVRQIALALVAGGTIVGGMYLWHGNEPQPAPGPQPVADLAALVDADARPFLSAFYRDWATAVRHPWITTTGHFTNAQKISVTIAQETGGLPSVADINEPIKQRIEAAIGKDDVALTNDLREKLAACLMQISEDFN